MNEKKQPALIYTVHKIAKHSTGLNGPHQRVRLLCTANSLMDWFQEKSHIIIDPCLDDKQNKRTNAWKQWKKKIHFHPNLHSLHPKKVLPEATINLNGKKSYDFDIQANQLSDILCRGATVSSVQSTNNTLTRNSTLRDTGDYDVPHPHPYTHHYMTTSTSATPQAMSIVGSSPQGSFIWITNHILLVFFPVSLSLSSSVSLCGRENHIILNWSALYTCERHTQLNNCKPKPKTKRKRKKRKTLTK